MPQVQFFKLTGVATGVDQVAAPQVCFLKCDNFVISRPQNALRKRGGSAEWSHTGDIWGISGYAKVNTSPRIPVQVVPVRHRRLGGTSYIEKLNWQTSTWDTITQGANTVFDVGDVASFAQVDDTLVICARKPAQIRDIASGNVNSLGGSAPSVAATVGAGGAGALTGSYRYVYTFYDSTTGWESSPSPISSTFSASSQQISVSGLATSSDREGVDKKRIYRTIATGEEPFFRQSEITLASASLTDNVADSALGTEAPESGDHDAPPNNSYVCAAHLGRIWIASGNVLYYSKEYDGSLNELEYFSTDRTIYFSHNITGLASTRSGGLMVFQPPGYGIYEVTGRSETTFQLLPIFPEEGTNFHASVAVHDDMVAYWGGDGPKVISPSGVVQGFDENIRNQLRTTLTDEYDTDIFCWTVWHPGERAFLFGLSATDTTGPAWIESGTSLAATWIDSTTGVAVDWT